MLMNTSIATEPMSIGKMSKLMLVFIAFWFGYCLGYQTAVDTHKPQMEVRHE